MDTFFFIFGHLFFHIRHSKIDIVSKYVIMNQGGEIMPKEVVKYKNDMNKLNFKGLGKSDMNLFIAICSKVKEQGENTIFIDFDYLRKISNYTGHTIDGFISDLKRMSQRIMAVNCEIITNNGGFDIFHLFNRFTADPKTQMLMVKIDPDFVWLLNEFTDRYTTFELQEFVKLQSKYAKTLYRILKQWRSTGQYIFNDIGDFRERMDVPEAYNSKRLMEKVITPAVREISRLDKSFINFKCEPLYAKKRGKPLAGYKFTWEAEKADNNASGWQLSNVEPATEPNKTQNEISQEKKDKLVNEFGKEIVEDYIERTKAYQCCNYDTIRRWILKDKDRKPRSKNQFNNFMQREVTNEEINELERKLLRKY